MGSQGVRYTIINLPPFSPTTVTKTLTLEKSNGQHKKTAGGEGGKSLLHSSLSPQINTISFCLILNLYLRVRCVLGPMSPNLWRVVLCRRCSMSSAADSPLATRDRCSGVSVFFMGCVLPSILMRLTAVGTLNQLIARPCPIWLLWACWWAG